MAKLNKRDKELIKKYKTLSKEIKPKPKYFKNIIFAFIVGGIICILGQWILNLLIHYGISEKQSKEWVPIIMILIGAILTGFGVYDRIASFAGAGTVVPITGFSNAVVSPAIEFKKEGFVLGVAAKMFTIAGPVLVYGIGSSVVIGIIYYFLQMYGLVK